MKSFARAPTSVSFKKKQQTEHILNSIGRKTLRGKKTQNNKQERKNINI